MPLSASGHRKRLLFKSQKRARADVLLISPVGWGGTLFISLRTGGRSPLWITPLSLWTSLANEPPKVYPCT